MANQMNQSRICALISLSTIAWAAGATAQTKPEAVRAAAPQTSGVWRNAVGDLAEHKWGLFGVIYMTVFPGRDEVIAGVSTRGLWSSTDGGTTWKQLGEPGQMDFRPIQVTFDPKTPDTFWATGIYGNGIYKTTNAGRSFDMLSTLSGEGISVDFADPDRRTLLTGGHEITNSLKLSTSSGRSWHDLNDGIPPGVTLLSTGFISGENTIIAGSDSRTRPGIYRSEDSGKTWRKVAPYVPAYQHAGFGSKPGVIYWAAMPSGLLKSEDGGKTWAGLGGPVTTTPIELPNGTLVGVGNLHLVASSNCGKTWRPFGPATPFQPIGVVYNSKRRAFYIWRFTGSYDRSAIMRWSP